MLSDYNFKEKDLKKIMPSDAAFEFAEKYCENPARKRPSKSNPLGKIKDPYAAILEQQWSPHQFCNKCIEFVTTKKGKYVDPPISGEKAESLDEAILCLSEALKIHQSYLIKLREKYHKNGLNSLHPITDDVKGICLPDAFSDSIVKRQVRKYFIPLPIGSDKFKKAEKSTQLLCLIHSFERSIMQIAGDLSELRLLKSNNKDDDNLIFPTFTHKAGDDFLSYDIKTRSFSGLDVKTSKWPKHFEERTDFDDPIPTREEAMSKPEKAIRRLYEKQGEDRFSSSPRLYLVRTPPGETVSTTESIREQFNNSYSIKFLYKAKGSKTSCEYKVDRAKIIFF